MPAGRPTKYDPAMCEAVIECGGQGMTLAEMAHELGISRDTLNEWRDSRPEFSAAVKDGLGAAQAWWEKQGRIATFGGIEGYNATSYIFQMKNRFSEDWRDKQDRELTGPNGGPIAVSKVEWAVVDPTAE